MVKKTILASWGVFFVFLLATCFFNGKKAFALQTILTIIFIGILIGTTLPDNIKNLVSNKITDQVVVTYNSIENVSPWDMSKLGHFCFFALFGFFLSFLMNQGSISLFMFNIILLAGGTEVAQFFIDERSPLLSDFFLDAGGGLSGIFTKIIFAKAF